MRALWDFFGAKNIGLPEDGFEKLAQKVTGLNLKTFFDNAVRGTDDLPLQNLLQDFGVDYELRAADSEADKGGKPGNVSARARVTLGAKISGNIEAKLQQVYDGGAAQKAGLSADDCIIALDGLRVNAATLDKMLGRKAPGDVVVILAFRRDELMAFDVTLQATPKDTCVLRLKEMRGSPAAKRRDDWLKP
jgi:predicted metalloprotease with PDZ domain